MQFLVMARVLETVVSDDDKRLRHKLAPEIERVILKNCTKQVDFHAVRPYSMYTHSLTEHQRR